MYLLCIRLAVGIGTSPLCIQLVLFFINFNIEMGMLTLPVKKESKKWLISAV